MRIGRFLLTAVITASAFTAMAAPQADKDKMDQFIDNLMGKMKNAAGFSRDEMFIL